MSTGETSETAGSTGGSTGLDIPPSPRPKRNSKHKRSIALPTVDTETTDVERDLAELAVAASTPSSLFPPSSSSTNSSLEESVTVGGGASTPSRGRSLSNSGRNSTPSISTKVTPSPSHNTLRASSPSPHGSGKLIIPSVSSSSSSSSSSVSSTLSPIPQSPTLFPASPSLIPSPSMIPPLSGSNHNNVPLSPTVDKLLQVPIAPKSKTIRNLSEDGKSYHFVDLKHQYPLLDEQVKIGLHAMRRTAALLKKAILLQDEFGKNLQRTIEHDLSEKRYLDDDGMKNHSKALAKLHDVYLTMGQKHVTFAENVQMDVVEPILEFAANAEVRRRAIAEKEAKTSGDVIQATQALERNRFACLKDWTELLEYKKERDKLTITKSMDMEKLTKVVRKINQKKEKAIKSFKDYEIQTATLEKIVNLYRNVTFPDILEDLEQLERDRLLVLEKQLKEFGELLKEHISYGAVANPFFLLLKELDVEQDVTKCVKTWLAEHGRPPPAASKIIELPCSSTDLSTSEWEAKAKEDSKLKVGGDTFSLAMTPLIVSKETAFADVVEQKKIVRQQNDEMAASPQLGSSKPKDLHMDGLSLTGEGTMETKQIETKSPTDSEISDSDHSTPRTKSPRNSDPGAPPPSDAKWRNAPKSYQQAKEEMALLEGQDLDEWVYALQDYAPKPEQKEHLSFLEEDIIKVVSKEDPEWWVGEVVGGGTHKRGKFPQSAIEEIYAFKREKKGGDEKNAGGMMDHIKSKVSKKKRRFMKDGYNLDLTYITPRLIAMGFPSEKLAGMYRNHIKDVQRFLKTRHAKKYKLYNLCSEREYKDDKFEGRVAKYPFDDHNPCAYNIIEPFCKDVEEHLKKGEGNICAIHCKAGKGRTGFLIACYLVWDGSFLTTAAEALRYYAIKRTTDCKGVTIPSQLRYVYYFEKQIKLKRQGKDIPDKNPLLLVSIRLHSIPSGLLPEKLHFAVVTEDGKFSSKGNIKCQNRKAEDYLFFHGGSGGIATVDHDIQLIFYHDTMFDKEKLFQLWFNTRFITFEEENGKPSKDVRLIFQKSQLDKACKDTGHKLYSDTFHVELILRSP